MAETYCGKACTDCTYREELNCPGCKAGPGRQISGDCELARCCRNKRHQECTGCGLHGNCRILQGRVRMAEYRKKSLDAEAARAAAIAERAPVLGKWLWILFWLIIPSSVASAMTNETVAGAIPFVFVPGQVLSAICSFVYGFILIRLTSEEERYRTAGICALVGGAASALIACISGGSEIPAWMLLITVPATIVSFVGVYHEFTAHCAVLTGLDNELAEKWSSLWKWYIGMYGAMLGSLLIVVIIPIVGLLVTIATAIGLIVVSILKLVYLYQTAKRFKEYSAEMV